MQGNNWGKIQSSLFYYPGSRAWLQAIITETNTCIFHNLLKINKIEKKLCRFLLTGCKNYEPGLQFYRSKWCLIMKSNYILLFVSQNSRCNCFSSRQHQFICYCMWFSGLAINNGNPYKANVALSLSQASQLPFCIDFCLAQSCSCLLRRYSAHLLMCSLCIWR